MPLRDHFHPPWSDENPWEGFHNAWANTVVRHLNGSLLSPNFRALPQIRLGRGLCEVCVHNTRGRMRLVAVVELVSPGNKDRAEERQAFVAKCAAYLQEQVGVVLLDIVTTRHANLHQELLRLLSAPPVEVGPAELYCVSYCNLREGNRWRLKTWPFPLTVGGSLPTVPLWLAGVTAVPLELETSYEETCKVLRIE